MIRVQLPFHLRTLAGINGDVLLDVGEEASISSVLDALEEKFPNLRGTIRQSGNSQRRPLIRFFACREDLSHQPPDAPLPPEVIAGEEPLIVVGAMAGG